MLNSTLGTLELHIVHFPFRWDVEKALGDHEPAGWFLLQWAIVLADQIEAGQNLHTVLRRIPLLTLKYGVQRLEGRVFFQAHFALLHQLWGLVLVRGSADHDAVWVLLSAIFLIHLRNLA